jgi:hypothetical protein
MATSTITSVIQQSTDAEFQAWVAEVISQLTAVGLTQTADTGQINTSTVTRPSANTSAGYTIWRFNDTLQSTKPIFIKLEFGSNTSGNTYPQMWISTSTGTNGAGTLNSTGLTARQYVCTAVNATSSTTYPSYFCYNATIGFLGMVWKYGGSGSTNNSLGGFFIGRSNNSSGNPTGDAMFLLGSGIAATSTFGYPCGVMQCYSWLTNSLYPSSTSSQNYQNQGWSYWPMCAISTVNTGSSYQVWPGFIQTPNLQFTQCIGLCLTSEIPWITTFTTALIGSTPQTYLNVVSTPGSIYPIICADTNVNTSTISVFMLWQ